jgi:hypothetical protein
MLRIILVGVVTSGLIVSLLAHSIVGILQDDSGQKKKWNIIREAVTPPSQTCPPAASS